MTFVHIFTAEIIVFKICSLPTVLTTSMLYLLVLFLNFLLTFKILLSNLQIFIFVFIYISVLDSSGNVPSGLFSGNYVDMGFYDECMDIVEDIDNELIKGKYCYGGLVIPLNQSNVATYKDEFINDHVKKV